MNQIDGNFSCTHAVKGIPRSSYIRTLSISLGFQCIWWTSTVSVNTETGTGMTGVDIRNGESVCILARRPKNLLPVQGGSSKMEFCALCLAVKKSLGNLTLVCLSLLYINEHLLFYYKGDCTLVSTWQLLQLVKEGKQAKYVKQLSNKTKINPVEHTWNHVTRCPCQPLYKLTTFNALLVA